FADEREHQEQDHPLQTRYVPRDDVVVDRHLDELRTERTQIGRHHHRDEGDGDPPFVGREKGDDSAEEVPVEARFFAFLLLVTFCFVLSQGSMPSALRPPLWRGRPYAPPLPVVAVRCN